VADTFNHYVRIFQQAVGGKGAFLVAAASPSTLDDIQKRLFVQQLPHAIDLQWIDSLLLTDDLIGIVYRSRPIAVLTVVGLNVFRQQCQR
jgi:hypothetical protein